MTLLEILFPSAPFIIALASLAGCLGMFLVCASQISELFAAAKPAPHPWEINRPCKNNWAGYPPAFAQLRT